MGDERTPWRATARLVRSLLQTVPPAIRRRVWERLVSAGLARAGRRKDDERPS